MSCRAADQCSGAGGDHTAPGKRLWQRIDRVDLARLAAVVVIAAAAAAASWLDVPWQATAGLAVLGLGIGCSPVMIAALRDIRSRRMSMELSMVIAIIAAAVIGEWVTSLVITAFVLAAEILEDLTMDRGRDALTELMGFLPTEVRVRFGDGERLVPLGEVRMGDLVLVAPGGKVPVDGTVLEGASSVDQSRVTGEPLPVDVGPGSAVYSGSVNQTGMLVVRADKVGEASSYGQIIAAVRAAQRSQAPVQRLANRIAGWLVYLALGGAALTFAITRDVVATLSVVIVAGACGVAAGTPLAVLAAIARAARTGAFVRDGRHLEALSRVDTVVFDKTGTLTLGQAAVVGVHPAPGFAEEALIQAAAGAEAPSEHPIGRAIVAYARARGWPAPAPDRFEYQPGVGVTAAVAGRVVRVGTERLMPEPGGEAKPAGLTGSGLGAEAKAAPGCPGDRSASAAELWDNAEAGAERAPKFAGAGTTVYVSVDGEYAGGIVLSDTVRTGAAECVERLRAMGLETVMMTGDNEDEAQAVGRRVGVDQVHARLLPTDKMLLVEQLRAKGRRVAMVGDGVNDAPALAQANVGVAMGSGTYAAQETADLVLVSSDLGDLTAVIRIARRARRIILANVVGTVAVDLLGMALAAVGILGPLLAAVIHVGSESGFILNSARLIPRPGSARAPGLPETARAEPSHSPC